MPSFNLISADSHVYEPGDLWQKYTDPKFKDKAPRLVQQNGEDRLVADWGLNSSPGMGVSAGKKPEDVKLGGTYAAGRQGAWDPDQRIKDMAEDGVDAEVLYPTVSMSLYHCPDRELLMAMFKAYNDWMVDFCATKPNQLVGVGVVSLDDMQAVAEETKRVAQKGLRGIMVQAEPTPDRPFGHPTLYDPFWAAAQETGLPVSLHSFAGPVRSVETADWCVTYSVATAQIQKSIAALIFSGVFERFPDLTVVSVENDVSWAPNFMERMDHAYNRHRFWAGTQLKSGKLPSQFFKDHIKMTFIRDQAAAVTRHIIGLDSLFWSSDYPHADTSWPQSRALVDKQFAGMPEAELRQITRDNTIKLYHLN